jgi:hypothetical protein
VDWEGGGAGRGEVKNVRIYPLSLSGGPLWWVAASSSLRWVRGGCTTMRPIYAMSNHPLCSSW